MSKKRILLVLIGILAFVISPASGSDGPYQVVNGPKDFYYGHISLTDVRNDGADPLVLRGDSDKGEPAALNLPVGPGDIIRTTGERRVEIQFDNATIVRLDVDSELKIETIMAQSLSSKSQISNLVLRRGRCYIMYKQFNSKELFQVLTPLAAVKFKHNSVAMIGLPAGGGTEIQVKYGKATLLYGADPKALKDQILYASERMTISADGRFAIQGYRADTDFEAWNKSINDDFLELHKGLTPLPKPVQKLSSAVFEFAQKFGNRYGEWMYDDYFGYVWRPYYNDHYPWGTWAPYYAGRWSNYNGQMFWVPTEPWGWIPYHLGVWQWDNKKGWYWIPGSAFAPAWVDWAFFGGSFWAWRPWSMWDWGFYGYPYLFADWFMDPYWGWRSGWGYGGYDPWLWGGYPYQGGGTAVPDKTLRTVSKDQLKAPSKPHLAMPKEFQAGLKSLMEGLRRHDPGAVDSMLAVGRQAVVVDHRSLNSPNVGEKSVPLAGLLGAARVLPMPDAAKILLSAPPLSADRSANLASRQFAFNQRQIGQTEQRARIQNGERLLASPRAFPLALRVLNSPTSVRHLDWNPDVRMAAKMGVDVRYASSANEIYCPQLNISSSTVHARGVSGGGMASYNGSSSGGSDGSGSSGGHSGGSGGAVSSGGSATSSAGSASAGGGSGGGHIR